VRRLPRIDSSLAYTSNGFPTEPFRLLVDKQNRLIEQALDANDALDATQSAALDALNDTTQKANACYEQLGPGAYAFTASATLPEDCRTAIVDATAGAVTVTLRPVADCISDVVVVKVDASGNAVVIDGDGAETISGAATSSTTTQWVSRTVRPALGAWYLI
jgi:hypothetical protein